MTQRQRRLTRDGAIVTVALTLSTYEVVLGEGRPAVLTFLAALIAYPAAAKLDRDSLRRRDGESSDDAATRS